MASFLILGCGYTGGRVAAKLRASGHPVVCTRRQDCDVTDTRSVTNLASSLVPGMSVLYSVPTVGSVPTGLFSLLRSFAPARFLYLSTTGVYGDAFRVDADTRPSPQGEREEERLETEQCVAEQFGRTLILRPAAIYGPQRGIHVGARHGLFRSPPGGGNRLVSRIHVNDLVRHILAGFGSDLEGSFPVADEEPCTSLELAEWTCRYLKLPPPVMEQREEGENSRLGKGGRSVDGSRVRDLLKIRLEFPSFRDGVPACLRAESA